MTDGEEEETEGRDVRAPSNVRARVMRKKRPAGAAKVSLVYAESYHAPGLRIKAHCLPTLPSATAGFEVVEAYVMKAGSLERAGESFEFQDVRMYLREKESTAGRS